MKALVTRIHKGSVTVEDKKISSVERGIAVFAAMEENDDDNAMLELADKIVHLRIFENEEGKMHYSVKDRNYEILCISNFTLSANTKKGRRPSFEKSMTPVSAKKMFDNFVMILKAHDVTVKTGEFGAHMDIELVMDGPVNIMLESNK